MERLAAAAVEYESIRCAKEALRERSAFTRGFDLSPNQTADIGMICGGKVVVYFQYYAGSDRAAADMFAHIVSLFDKDANAWLAMHITDGCVRQMGVYEEGTGLLFADMPEDIVRPMLTSRSVLQKGEPGFYVEPLVRAGTVYVFGGGHVSQELVPLIAHVDFRTVVYEDREAFADPSLFPAAADTIIAPFDQVGEHLCISEKDYVVIMTRGHQWDYVVLEQAMRTPATYIGVIGSRQKITATYSRLMEAGIPEAQLGRIHNPIGLPIRGETPAEIAISIAAQLILHRAQLSGAKA